MKVFLLFGLLFGLLGALHCSEYFDRNPIPGERRHAYINENGDISFSHQNSPQGPGWKLYNHPTLGETYVPYARKQRNADGFIIGPNFVGQGGGAVIFDDRGNAIIKTNDGSSVIADPNGNAIVYGRGMANPLYY